LIHCLRNMCCCITILQQALPCHACPQTTRCSGVEANARCRCVFTGETALWV
jgi:hypothetical protein